MYVLYTVQLSSMQNASSIYNIYIYKLTDRLF